MQQPKKKKSLSGKLIPALIFLLIALPSEVIAVLLVVAIPVGLFCLTFQICKKKAADQQSNTLDDCPQPLICLHKDKGEHHVRRGKEIDPWDRPDIDIRKYQRKQ